MATIRVKRTQSEISAGHKLKPGELGIANNRFFYGPKETADDSGLVTPIGVAGLNIENNFIGKNTFDGGNLVLKAASGKTITFVDSGGSTKYTFGANGKFTTEHTIFDSNMLVSKAYVDARVQGLNIKKSVKAASTEVLGGTLDASKTRLTLTAPGKLTLDGVTDLDFNDRVLIKNQTDANQNGIYIVDVVGGTGITPSLVRADDADTPEKLRAAFVFVEEGNTQADTGWNCITDGALLEDGEYYWTQFSGAGSYNGDRDTITRDGTVFRLADQPGLSVLGVTANAQGKPAPIEAGTDGHVLRRDGTSLTFGTLPSGAFANNTIDYSRLKYSNVGGFLGHSGKTSSAIEMISSSTAGHVPVIGANSTLTFDTIGNSSISTNANIEFSKLANGSAYSVLGVAGATATSVDSITAGTNSVLRRGASGNLGFGKITYAHIDSMSSSNFASIIENEDKTGTGKVVFATSPTFTTSVLGSGTTMEVFNTGNTTVKAFGAATTLSIGHNSTVGTSSTEIAPGALVSGTKYVGIGTGGTGTSSTSIYIGPSGGSTFNTNINGILVTSSGIDVSGTFYRQDTTAIPTQTSKLKYAGWLYATRFEGLIDGGTWS